MYNQTKIKLIRKALMGIIGLVLLLGGYALASIQYTLAQRQEKQETVSTSTEEEKKEELTLTEEKVKEFLLAFYTKKDLEENRPRYKPFMTEGMYKATVADEEKPVSQAYKGYVLDQVFEKASIYIDKEHKEALAVVSYSHQTVEEKGNPNSKSLKGTNTVNIVISYVEQNGQLLVNNIKPALFELAKNQGGDSYYNDTTSTSQSNATSSSQATSSSSSRQTSSSSPAPTSASKEER